MRIAAYPSIAIIGTLAGLFLCSLCCRKGSSACREDHKLREHLSEKQIDKMLADSFPASDPPSTY